MLTTNPFDDDKLHEECGIFGIYGHEDAAALTALGLHALQHRGQEATGMVTHDGNRFHSHRGLGHVADNFSREATIRRLPGRSAIGHNRYSTTGETVERNIQPLFADFEFGGFAIGHNGNLTNAIALRHELVRKGSLFQSTTDTETIVHLMATSSYSTVTDRMIDALRQVEGAYSLVALSHDGLIGVRDSLGVRPLVLGKFEDSYVLASESCALDIIGADYMRDIEPGEMVVINDKGIESLKPFVASARRSCIFEYIYFARPDSVMEGRSVYEARKNIGAELARESHVRADMVIPVPDSGVPAAIGYAREAKIPFELGIIRNHYVGRTFIEPTDNIRNLGVKLKHNANRASIDGKRVILVDDSIVRGTTSKKIVEMVRAAGATEVHMRIASPPTTHSCFYGVDTPERSKLLAAQYSIEDMARFIGVDFLAFISMDGLYRAMGEKSRDDARPQFCDACFSGDYPIRLTDQDGVDKPAQLSFLKEVVTRAGTMTQPNGGTITEPNGGTIAEPHGGTITAPAGRLTGRIALITGASRGIGAAVAKRFAAEGAHVILTARTTGGLEEIDDAIGVIAKQGGGGQATLVPLDLLDGDKIDQLGVAIAQRFGRLDVLVGNAGRLGALTPMSHIDPPQWERTLGVNLTANWRLIRILEPLLRLSPAGRAIFVTSSAADGRHPYWGAYAISKAGLEAMVKTWAGELNKTNLRVNLLDPGATRTRLRAEAYPGEDPLKLKPPEDVTEAFVRLAMASETRHGEIVSTAD